MHEVFECVRLSDLRLEGVDMLVARERRRKDDLVTSEGKKFAFSEFAATQPCSAFSPVSVYAIHGFPHTFSPRLHRTFWGAVDGRSQ